VGKAKDIVAEIQADIPARARGGRWFERLTAEQQEVVEVIAAAWVAGEFGEYARPICPAIAKRLQAAGVSVTPYTVREWLSGLIRS